MVEPLRHRQTKEAETDMFSLQPLRHVWTLTAILEGKRTQLGHRGIDADDP